MLLAQVFVATSSFMGAAASAAATVRLLGTSGRSSHTIHLQSEGLTLHSGLVRKTHLSHLLHRDCR